MKHTFTSIALAIVAALLASCSRSTQTGETLKIAYLPITHALPLFASAELPDSLRQNSNVELLKFGSWTELSDALNSGRIDGAVMLTEIAIKARELKVPVRAVALGHHDGNVVVVANDISSPTDLAGKTVAIPHRLSSHHIILQIILEKYGIDPQSVQLTELPPPEMPAALSEGRIAAYIVAEPFGAKGVVSGVGKALFTSPEVWPHSVCCTLVFREEVLRDRHADVQSFIDDYRRAADQLAADTDWAKAVAKKHLKADERVLDKSLEWIDFSDLSLQRDEYTVLTDWMEHLGLSKHAPAFEEFADTTLLRY